MYAVNGQEFPGASTPLTVSLHLSICLSDCMYVYVSADRLLVTFIASLASYMLKTLVKTHREDERLKLNA